MKYFEELDAWLTAVLWPQEEEDEEEWFTRVKKQLKEKILDSYRNGQAAGLQPKSGRKEEPREPRARRPWPPRRPSQRQ